MAEIINIVSYNIHKGFTARRTAFVLPQIREHLIALNPDLLFLQEVQGKQKLSRLKKTSAVTQTHPEYIAESTWPFYIYGRNAVYGDAHHGNAILSKFPFQSWQNVNVALQKRASRSVLHGVIQLQNKNVHVICIHMGLFKAERQKQMAILLEHIHQEVPQEAPLIVAGDFNDWQSNLLNYLMLDCGLQEVCRQFYGEYIKTYPSRRPAFAPDHIFFRGLKLLDAQVLKNLPWKKLSDHLPLAAQFQMIG